MAGSIKSLFKRGEIVCPITMINLYTMKTITTTIKRIWGIFPMIEPCEKACG